MVRDVFAPDIQGSMSLHLGPLQSVGRYLDCRNCGLTRLITFQGTNLRTYYHLFVQQWHTDRATQKMIQDMWVGSIHARRFCAPSPIILETHRTGQDRSRCFALRMRTRDPMLRGVLQQMLLNLIHHLVGFGVLEDPVLVG